MSILGSELNGSILGIQAESKKTSTLFLDSR